MGKSRLKIKLFNDPRIEAFDLTSSNLDEFKALVLLVEQEEKDRLARMIAKSSPEINLDLGVVLTGFVH